MKHSVGEVLESLNTLVGHLGARDGLCSGLRAMRAGLRTQHLRPVSKIQKDEHKFRSDLKPTSVIPRILRAALSLRV